MHYRPLHGFTSGRREVIMAVTSMKGCVDVEESLLFNVFTTRGGRDVEFSLILDNP